MQRQAIAARARPDVMQPGTRANGEAMGAGPSVYSGDAAAALYFYQQLPATALRRFGMLVPGSARKHYLGFGMVSMRRLQRFPPMEIRC